MRRRAGYTLVEVILVVVVAGIAMPPLMAVFAEMSHKSARPDLLLIATTLAREKMEIIASDKFNTSRGYAYLVSGNYPAESPVTGSTFTRTVTFTDVASSDLSTAQAGSGYRKAVVWAFRCEFPGENRKAADSEIHGSSAPD